VIVGKHRLVWYAILPLWTWPRLSVSSKWLKRSSFL
jgi:hypothetical protein